MRIILFIFRPGIFLFFHYYFLGGGRYFSIREEFLSWKASWMWIFIILRKDRGTRPGIINGIRSGINYKQGPWKKSEKKEEREKIEERLESDFFFFFKTSAILLFVIDWRNLKRFNQREILISGCEALTL